jgi:hypothetical protein
MRQKKGRTVPSSRMAAEIERTKWTQFRSFLDKNDRKLFDQMFDCAKLHNAACSNAGPLLLLPSFFSAYLIWDL